jgi:integrase
MGTIYSFAISEEKIPSVSQMASGGFESSNPVSRVKGIAVSSEYEAIALTPGQALKVLQELRQPEYTMLLLVAITGMRQSELLGLRWSDILWERSEIRIKETFVHGNIQQGGKTKLSRSRVVLHPVLLQLLKDWRAESVHASDTDYVFASVKNGGKTPRCGSMVVEDYLRPAAIRAKVIEIRDDGNTYIDGEVVKRFGFHTLRHSLTSWMMDAGENPQIVRSMLRWTNLNMLAHYTHGFKHTKLEAQGRVLEAVLGNNGSHNGSQVQ